MASNTLARYETQDGIELVINQKTGEAFASQSATARMCNVSETAIRNFITSNQIGVKKSEVLTNTGFKTSNLLNEDSILKCLKHYNPEMLLNFAKLGLRMSLHRIAGFKLPSTEKATPTVESSLTDKELLKTFTDLYARATRTGNKRLLLIAENNIADIAEKINPGSDSYDEAQPVYSDLTPIEKFMLKEVVVTNNHTDKLSSLQLYTAFVKWQGSASVSRSKFTKSVRALQKGTFHEKIRSGGIRTSGFTGIKFVNN